MTRDSDSRLVYSTDDGDRRRVPDAVSSAPVSAGDGIIRVSRETSGRRGKTVTVVRGVAAADLASTAGDLKRVCGSGGTVKDGVLEIQGDAPGAGRRPAWSRSAMSWKRAGG